MFFTRNYLRRLLTNILPTQLSVDDVETKVDTVDTVVDSNATKLTDLDTLIDGAIIKIDTANLNLERVLYLLAPTVYSNPDA